MSITIKNLIVFSVLSFLTDLGSNHPTEHDSDGENHLSRVKRLAGARSAYIGDFPYIVEIAFGDHTQCFGALTLGAEGNQIVVTTGTCVTQFVNDLLIHRDNFQILAGYSEWRYYLKQYSQIRKIRHVVRHEDWTRRGQYDIGLLYLDSDFDITPFVKPVSLPPFQWFYPNTTLLIASWGQLKVGDSELHSDKLQMFQMDPYPTDKCKQEYAYVGHDVIWDYQTFCVADPELDGKRGFCDTDRGAPAVTIFPETDLLYLAGIFSWVQPECSQTKKPGIFMMMSGLSGWILGHSYPLLETDNAPYYVQITFRDQHLCSGALVIAPDGNTIVLTTAECITNDRTEQNPESIRQQTLLKVRVGVDNANDSKAVPTERIQSREVAKIVRHPDWKRDAKHDIAILIPESPFERNRFSEPISLPPDNFTYPETDQRITITALGNDKTRNAFSSLLHQVNVKSLSLDDCIKAYEPTYGKDLVSADTSLCTQDPDLEGAYGPCLDNIGAPAGTLNHRTGDYYLVGIFSWRAPDCGKSQLPPIFTSISAHMKFITENSEPPSQSDNSTDPAP